MSGVELYTNCVQLKSPSSDGKSYLTDCANTEGPFRRHSHLCPVSSNFFNSLDMTWPDALPANRLTHKPINAENGALGFDLMISIIP